MPAVLSYREAGDQPGAKGPTKVERQEKCDALSSSPHKPQLAAQASGLDSMSLLPLEVVDDQETWLCAALLQAKGALQLESWPIDIEGVVSFDDTESVSSVSVQCGEFEHLMDIADWYGLELDVDDVQLLFPVDCTTDDMGWLLMEDADELADIAVELLFPAGCTETDKEWLMTPSGCSTSSDMEWLVPALDIEGLDHEDSF